MTGGRATVVIITQNRKAELLQTLQRMTTLPDRAPVVVVDNGSTDGTADAVAEHFSQVRLVRSARNLGALGRNLAVRDIDTRYVAFCDDDTRWRPGGGAPAPHPGRRPARRSPATGFGDRTDSGGSGDDRGSHHS
jgi:glycosyltransferase involved in cell wall biosynthesis